MGIYDNREPIADKYLYADGSIRSSDGAIIEAADERRAEIYKARSPNVAKWLLADGSIVEELPGSGSGGSGITMQDVKNYVDQELAEMQLKIETV